MTFVENYGALSCSMGIYWNVYGLSPILKHLCPNFQPSKYRKLGNPGENFSLSFQAGHGFLFGRFLIVCYQLNWSSICKNHCVLEACHIVILLHVFLSIPKCTRVYHLLCQTFSKNYWSCFYFFYFKNKKFYFQSTLIPHKKILLSQSPIENTLIPIKNYFLF